MKDRYLCFLIILTGLAGTPIFAGEITFSGDGRVRAILRNNTFFGNVDGPDQDSWDSRVRLVAKGKADGGAYARARVRFNSKWRETDARTEFIDPTVDIAYLGIPLGGAIIEAGRMKNNVTRFFEWDQGVDQARLLWDWHDTHWIASYRVLREGTLSEFEIDKIENNDDVAYGLIAKRQLSDDLLAQANLFYADDQRNEFVTGKFIPPASGFYSSIFFDAHFLGFNLVTEAAYKDGNVRQTRDETGAVINEKSVLRGDGWGWYAEIEYPLGSFLPSFNTGFAVNGYEADNDFGWILIGNSNNEPIAIISQIGGLGDWFWFAPSFGYFPNSRFKLKGHLVWIAIEDQRKEFGPDDTWSFQHLLELSADATFIFTDQVTLTWKLGWLKPDLNGFYEEEPIKQETAFASYVRLQVNF